MTPKVPPSFLLSLCPPGYWGLWPGDYKCHYLLLLDSEGATSLLTAALLLLLLEQEQGHFKRQLCHLNIPADSTLLLFQNVSSQTTPRLHRSSMIKECTAEDLTSSCCCCVHDMGNWGPVIFFFTDCQYNVALP